MPKPHVRQNRIMLVVFSSTLLATGLVASAGLMMSPRPAPLLMSVMGTTDDDAASMNERSSQTAVPDIEIATEAPLAMNDVAPAVDDGTRWFNGRPVRPAGTMKMLVTAYSPDAQSCGNQADGITASGYSVWTNGMKLVAADTRVLPFGSLVSIPGYGDEQSEIVPVLDRGGKIKGQRLDVLFPTHEVAKKWGARHLEVTLWEYADGLPDDFHTQHHR